MMTSRQKQSALDLLVNAVSEEEFLRRFRTTRAGAGKLSLNILEEAERTKSADEVRYGLLIGSRFGISPDHLEVLRRLSNADWHTEHEDIVMALNELRDRRAVDDLYQAAVKLYPYLEYDESHALAVKAIWALGNLKDPAADERLRWLAKSDEKIVRSEALNQLQRRQGEEEGHRS
jgi:hypothetical protein